MNKGNEKINADQKSQSNRKLSTSEFITMVVERMTKSFEGIPKDVALCILYQVISNFVDDTDDRQN